MKHLLRYEEWQGASGLWYCNDTSDLKSNAGKWWMPARMLNISPADFVQKLITQFAPDRIEYHQEADVLVYGWHSQAAMRKYKNWLNAEARKKNFII